MKSISSHPWRHILTTCLALTLGALTAACMGLEAESSESWTQQDEFFEGSAMGEASYSVHNCPAGQEWDSTWGCQPAWGVSCYYTRGSGYVGFEPFCSKLPSTSPIPHNTKVCSTTRGGGWCGTEPNCYSCPVHCSVNRGPEWCGGEPNCYLCPLSCESTRGQNWCGTEPSCYACGPSCSSTRGTGWCGIEPSCYTCTNGGGTSEGG
ncbi:hypothetical protein HUA74_35195 [Myxococcus sp. CA051A]|uniref:hypothetical protein n=1 Tax=Myxococcus sp. CA051A TaxID=2741739 RepID=UPI00157A2506|nr:hypothetical protein [Myxococcus sp. CA051A]NTX65919.1 hypothetical protein [Myxococcus sp. CA051A]